MLGFASTASLASSGEKLGTDPWIDQLARCELCREPFFSGAVGLLKSVDDSWKVARYGDRPQEAYTGHIWTGVENVCVVLVGFSPTGCASIQIAAALEYE
jgi:hypothetical protein